MIRTEAGPVQGPGLSLQTPSVAQVRSRRCDVKTKFVTHIPCTMCPAIKKRVCPSGWLREFPEKIEDCRCRPPPPSLPLPRASPGVSGDQEEPGRPGREGRVSLLHMSVGSSSGAERGGVRGRGRWSLLNSCDGQAVCLTPGLAPRWEVE